MVKARTHYQSPLTLSKFKYCPFGGTEFNSSSSEQVLVDTDATHWNLAGYKVTVKGIQRGSYGVSTGVLRGSYGYHSALRPYIFNMY